MTSRAIAYAGPYPIRTHRTVAQVDATSLTPTEAEAARDQAWHDFCTSRASNPRDHIMASHALALALFRGSRA